MTRALRDLQRRLDRRLAQMHEPLAAAAQRADATHDAAVRWLGARDGERRVGA